MSKSLQVSVSLNEGQYSCIIGTQGFTDEEFTIAEKITIMSGILGNLWEEVAEEYSRVTGIADPSSKDLEDYIYFQRDGMDT